MSKTTRALAIVAMASSIAAPALAKEIPIAGHGRADVYKACKGTYFHNKSTPTYGCLGDDGSVIVCGGQTPQQKKTCVTSRQAPKPYLFPSRADFEHAKP